MTSCLFNIENKGEIIGLNIVRKIIYYHDTGKKVVVGCCLQDLILYSMSVWCIWILYLCFFQEIMEHRVYALRFSSDRQ